MMKKTLVFLVLFLVVTFTLAAADSSEVIARAELDAQADGRTISVFGVGLGAFVFSFMGTPLAGLVFALVAYQCTEAVVPAARLSDARQTYGEPDLVVLYEEHYRETLTSIRRRKYGGAALVGTGLATAVYIGVVMYFMSALAGVG
jgi:hypothetical protein